MASRTFLAVHPTEATLISQRFVRDVGPQLDQERVGFAQIGSCRVDAGRVEWAAARQTITRSPIDGLQTSRDGGRRSSSITKYPLASPACGRRRPTPRSWIIQRLRFTLRKIVALASRKRACDTLGKTRL